MAKKIQKKWKIGQSKGKEKKNENQYKRKFRGGNKKTKNGLKIDEKTEKVVELKFDIKNDDNKMSLKRYQGDSTESFWEATDKWIDAFDRWHKKFMERFDADQNWPSHVLDLRVGVSTTKKKDSDSSNPPYEVVDRMRKELKEAEKDFTKMTPKEDKNGVEIYVDVERYRPGEITVRTLDDIKGEKVIVIEGKHDERKENNAYVTRKFIRKYQLPQGYDAEYVTSTLSSDGLLTVKAPSPAGALAAARNERIVEIRPVGPAKNKAIEGRK